MFSETFILVTGADLDDRETILEALGDQCHIVAAQTAEDALAHLGDSVDLVITELQSGQLDAMELLRDWKLRQPRTPFLVMTDGRDVTSAVDAMKNGAADCIVKPLDPDELRSAALELMNSHGGSPRTGSNHSEPATRSKLAIDIPPGTSLEDLERAAVEQALIEHRGNRTHAAKTLGISVRTLQRKLKAWGLPVVSIPNSAANNNFIMPTPAASHSIFSTHVH